MKKVYERPTFEMIEIENKDIITESPTTTPITTPTNASVSDETIGIV